MKYISLHEIVFITKQHTVVDAGCLPDISWYKVCNGSFIGRELANRIMTVACVRASVLLASSRA